MIIISISIAILILLWQGHYFKDTQKHRRVVETFFDKKSGYGSRTCEENGELYPQIDYVGMGEDSDLNNLIKEINTYLFKTKGTSDYQFIQNKVERKINLRLDQASVYQSFPTYIGLMGTFLGVFIGITAFIIGFDSSSFSDDAIRNLLQGVLVSMFTSLWGLLLTTYNNAKAGSARKKVEDEKNEFFDFIQTDVTKTASASLVSAISKLHDTVDKFEPAFSKVIDGFKIAFKECTMAFGEDFKQNVNAVTQAVEVMGNNMDKINTNINLQQKLIDAIKSQELINGMDKYVEAANHFVSITQSLNKFEEARRMMLLAAQESITIQNQYSESLKIPREVAVKVNMILDRIVTFEQSINETGKALQQRDIIGNDVLTSIQNQIKGIARKGKIADRFLEIADGKLEDLYSNQTAAINEMNRRYKDAIEGHIQGFEAMIELQTKELEARHNDFLQTLQAKFNIEDIRSEFSNLKTLRDIITQIKELNSNPVKARDLKQIEESMQKIQTSISNIEESQKRGTLFGFSRR